MRALRNVSLALLLGLGCAALAAPKKRPAPPPAPPAKKVPGGVPGTTPVGGSPPQADAAPAGEGGAPPPTRGPSRIDFDDRLIQGQTNKSGAVYLYDRKELKIRSMIKKRETFRDEIVGSLFDG